MKRFQTCKQDPELVNRTRVAETLSAKTPSTAAMPASARRDSLETRSKAAKVRTKTTFLTLYVIVPLRLGNSLRRLKRKRTAALNYLKHWITVKGCPSLN